MVRDGSLLTRSDLVSYLGLGSFMIDNQNKMGLVERGTVNTIVEGPAISGMTPPIEDYHTLVDKLLPYSGHPDMLPESAEELYQALAHLSGPQGSHPYGFYAPAFSLGGYFEDQIARRLPTEFKMEPTDYDLVQYLFVGNQMLVNDPVPYVAVVIRAKESWEDIAQKCFGDQRAISNHPAFYAFDATPEAFDALMGVLPTFHANAFVTKRVLSDMQMNLY